MDALIKDPSTRVLGSTFTVDHWDDPASRDLVGSVLAVVHFEHPFLIASSHRGERMVIDTRCCVLRRLSQEFVVALYHQD